MKLIRRDVTKKIAEVIASLHDLFVFGAVNIATRAIEYLFCNFNDCTTVLSVLNKGCKVDDKSCFAAYISKSDVNFHESLLATKLLALAGWAAIAGLFEFRGPAAVIRLVVAVVVDAVKRVGASWACSHVSIEVGETVPPALANNDAAPAIAGVIGRVGVVATLDHGGPRAVLACFGFAMRGIGRGCHFTIETPATACVTARQIACQNNRGVAAITTAPPRAATQIGDSNQATEALVGNVVDVVMEWGKMLRSHIVTSVTILVRAASGVTSTGRCSRFRPHYTLGLA